MVYDTSSSGTCCTGIGASAKEEISIGAEALERHASGGVARMGSDEPPRGSLAGASCKLLRELNLSSLLRSLIGDLSV